MLYIINTGPEISSMENEWEMEYFDMQKDDMRKSLVDGVPTLDLCERLYVLIDHSMSKTLVVKLLGRKIRFNALWNKVYAMWKPTMRFQLMDIDNDYYLEKFKSKLDYSGVLSKGPWVIYGYYPQFNRGRCNFRLWKLFHKMLWLGSVYLNCLEHITKEVSCRK